jgi:hypothetical protein
VKISSESLFPFLRYLLTSLQKTLGGNHHPQRLPGASGSCERLSMSRRLTSFTCKDFKLTACSVQELFSSKVLLPNLDTAAAAAVCSTQQ